MSAKPRPFLTGGISLPPVRRRASPMRIAAMIGIASAATMLALRLWGIA